MKKSDTQLILEKLEQIEKRLSRLEKRKTGMNRPISPKKKPMRKKAKRTVRLGEPDCNSGYNLCDPRNARGC
ncbi:MAG: hypothetical protein DRO87_11915 [Candidatus Thorarchaeota archaeon]|nr:MAG: hypothetical protein DRO87_11915 [Candidatus Thorarchaeota archaeon]